MPNSSTSMPALATAPITDSVVVRSGSPATRYPISAALLCSRARRNGRSSPSGRIGSVIGVSAIAQKRLLTVRQLLDVLLAAPAQVDHQQTTGAGPLGDPVHQRQRVRALKGRNYPLALGAAVVGGYRLIVGNREVLGSSALLE